MLFTLLVAPAFAGVVTLLHDGPALADGRTETTIYLRIPGVSAEDKQKLRVSGARLISSEVADHDTVVVRLLPNMQRKPGQISVDVKVRGGISVDETVTVPVLPGVDGQLDIRFDPPVVQPGTEEVQVVITSSTSLYYPIGARQIALSATRGSVSEPVLQGESWTATYTPPEGIKAPVAALFTATDLATAQAVRGAATLPHATVHTLSFNGSPRSQARLVVGDRTYGPVTFTDAGTVDLVVDLRPGDPLEARLIVGEGDAAIERPVELPKAPSPAQVAWVPLGSTQVLGDRQKLWLTVTDEAGAPWVDAFKLKVKGADVSEEGQGWYTVSPEGRFSVDAQVEFENARLEGALERWPAAATIEASEDVLAEDVDTTRLKVTKEAVVFAHGGTVASGVLTATEAEVAAIAHYPVTVSTRPATRLRVTPLTSSASDGVLPLVVVAEDAFGLPVPGVAVTVTTPTGDASVTIPDTGVAVVPYAVGAIKGPVQVSARADALRAGTVIWQGVATPELPLLGSAADQAAHARWRGLVAGVGIENAMPVSEEPPPPVTAVSTPAPTPPAPSVPKPLEPPPVEDATASAEPSTAAAAEAAPAVPPAPAASSEDTSSETVSPEGASTTPAPASANQDDSWWGEAERGSGKDAPVFLVQVGLHDTGLTMRQSAPAGNETVPENAGFSKGFPAGALGLAGRVSARLSMGFGLDLRGRWSQYRIDVSNETRTDSLGSWQVGATYRHEIGSAWVGGLLGFHRTDLVGIVFDKEDPTRADVRQLALNGARLGVSGGVDLGMVTVRGEVSETFGIAPVDTAVELGALVALPVDIAGLPVYATADLGFEFRHVGLTLAGQPVTLRDRQDTVILGVALGNP